MQLDTPRPSPPLRRNPPHRLPHIFRESLGPTHRDKHTSGGTLVLLPAMEQRARAVDDGVQRALQLRPAGGDAQPERELRLQDFEDVRGRVGETPCVADRHL